MIGIEIETFYINGNFLLVVAMIGAWNSVINACICTIGQLYVRVNSLKNVDQKYQTFQMVEHCIYHEMHSYVDFVHGTLCMIPNACQLQTICTLNKCMTGSFNTFCGMLKLIN